MKVTMKKETNKFTIFHCFDPGGTTGYARLFVPSSRERIYIQELSEFPTWCKLDEIINEETPANHCVIYESFLVRILSAHLIPVEVIGVIRYLCLKHKVTAFPSEPKNQGHLKGDKPIVERWYPELSKFTSHSSSALRHGIHFITTQVFEKTKLVKLDYNYSELISKLKG